MEDRRPFMANTPTIAVDQPPDLFHTSGSTNTIHPGNDIHCLWGTATARLTWGGVGGGVGWGVLLVVVVVVVVVVVGGGGRSSCL